MREEDLKVKEIPSITSGTNRLCESSFGVLHEFEKITACWVGGFLNPK